MAPKYLLWLCGFVVAAVISAAEHRRPPQRRMLSESLIKELDDVGPTSPQQVHISLSGPNHMRISWITSYPTPPVVYYGPSPGPGSKRFSDNGTTNQYGYLTYQSGQTHDVVIGPLDPNSVYYYRCGSPSSPELTFKTPPSQFPIKFAIIGDPGQTEYTKSTLDHMSKAGYDVLILAGDLAYADLKQRLWDAFGHLVQPQASRRPRMVTQGNHEIERIPFIHKEKFTSYDAGSAQYRWLQADRGKTPWLVAIMHAPWYNTINAHQGEYESSVMRESMEDLLYKASVDVVFADHVHAYERFVRVYKNKADKCGPVYITIGDGGNREGLATNYIDPQPSISAFREPSFGHGQFQIANASHALWTWHRNDHDVAVASDQICTFDGENDGRYYDNLNEEANVHETESGNEDENEQVEHDNEIEDINDGRDYDDFNGEANVHENGHENIDENGQLEQDNENKDTGRRKNVNIHNVPAINLFQK
ncbi:Probable purple acid phosphatase 20 [Striga hermonthica]|uniref:Purple acid phosphatase n=1 Tax=Striga hermonthica TaxID=68872 RepID=A0A9N7MUD7_STRHE|nr:Probable purple acid phosphatase 20 [Striga hermonthica]